MRRDMRRDMRRTPRAWPLAAASHGLKSSRSGTSQRSRLTSERSLSFGVTSVTGSEHQSIASSAADVAADRLHVVRAAPSAALARARARPPARARARR